MVGRVGLFIGKRSGSQKKMVGGKGGSYITRDFSQY